MKPKPNLIAIASIIIVALTMGTYTAFSIYLGPIAEKFGAELSAVVLIFTLVSLCGMIVSFFLGNLIKLLGIKKFIIIEGIFVIIFFLSIAYASSLTIVYIGAFLFGVINGGFGVCQTAISVWFVKGQGTLVSLLLVGMGIAAMIMSPLISSALITYGVSSVCLVHGLVVGIVVIVLGLFAMAEPPEVYGMQPVGYDASAAAGQEAAAAPTVKISSIVKMAPFWLILLAGGLFNFVNGGVVGNASIIYQSMGTDAVQASMCISVYNGVLLAFSPLFGVISDKKGPSMGVLILGASTIVGSIMAMMGSGLTGAVVTAALLSACSVCGSMAPISIVRVFGPAQAGSLIGYSMVMAAVGQMLAPPIAARIYEGSGSFNSFMMLSIVLCVIVVCFMFIATSNKTIEKVSNSLKQG